MNFWATAFCTLAAGAAGWFACDMTKAKQFSEAQAGLQRAMLTYTGDTVAAQKKEADRVIASIVQSNAQRDAQRDTIQTIIKEVQSAPVTERCASSPAITIALDGLRRLAETRASGEQP